MIEWLHAHWQHVNWKAALLLAAIIIVIFVSILRRKRRPSNDELIRLGKGLLGTATSLAVAAWILVHDEADIGGFSLIVLVGLIPYGWTSLCAGYDAVREMWVAEAQALPPISPTAQVPADQPSTLKQRIEETNDDLKQRIGTPTEGDEPAESIDEETPRDPVPKRASKE